MLVEQAAAQFFEGRVLAVEPEHLRVQVTGGNDSLSVATSDVYALPPRAQTLMPNQLAICAHAQEWLPCRVREAVGASVDVLAATGVRFKVTPDRILAPSALTELNLKRYFARQEAEQAFLRGAQRAGEPRSESGWHPALHERLLVKLGGEWFTGYVRELGDDSAQVTLNTPQRIATVPLSALAAEPPSSVISELRRGDFVLVRPEASSQPWLPREVHSLSDSEIVLEDAAGTLKSASIREIVPLRP